MQCLIIPSHKITKKTKLIAENKHMGAYVVVKSISGTIIVSGKRKVDKFALLLD